MRKLNSLLIIAALLLTLVPTIAAQDEATTFVVTIENVSGGPLYENAGVQAIPVGGDAAGPATPGGAYEFTFSAGMSDSISFVTMLAQSNDLFFAPHESGIALYDADGNAISGDVTDQVDFWDAGTEVNEQIGEGPNQAPRQAGPNTGDDENGVVRLVTELDDGLSYPATSDIIAVTLTPGTDGEFTLRIENVSGDSAFASPITPVVWVVHSDMMGDDMMEDESMDDSDDMMDDGMMGVDGVFFTHGTPDRGQGLEYVAEDGNPAFLAEVIVNGASLATPITPIVFAVHDNMMDGGAFFNTGEADRGLGLENVAEDGDPTNLAGNIAGMDYAATGVSPIPFGAEEAGPALPGSGYEFTFDATPDTALSFVTMFVQSNDLFFGPSESGIPLFDDMGSPITGDVTRYVELWDAGTEINEEPGVGANQAPRQAGPNTGDDENGVVQLVASNGDGYSYPSVPSVIRVTIHVADDMMDS